MNPRAFSSSDNYTERQAAMDAEYLKAWRELSPAQREAMAAQGITGPETSRHAGTIAVNEHTLDRALGCAPEVRVESELDDLCEVAGIDEGQAVKVMAWHREQTDVALKAEISSMLYCIVMFLIRPGINHRLAHWGLVFAAGLDGLIAGKKSQAEIAKGLGESRALLNHYVSQWRDAIGYAVLKYCRTESARRAYASRASEVHARRLPAPAPEGPRLDAVGE